MNDFTYQSRISRKMSIFGGFVLFRGALKILSSIIESLIQKVGRICL